MNSFRAVTIWLTCLSVYCPPPAFPQTITIPADQRGAYERTKDRAERYNKVVEQKMAAVSCEVSQGFLIVRQRLYDVYKIQRIPARYAVACEVIDGQVQIDYRYRDERGFWSKLWTPTRAFIVGVVTGFASGFGLGQL